MATIPPEERMGGETQRPPPPLINVRGVWKVNLTPRTGSASPKATAAAVREYTEVLKQTATAIEAGQLKTVEETRGALRTAPELESAGDLPDLVLSLPK